VAELHAVDLGEAELLDLAMERVGHPFDHEHQARRPRGRDLDRGIEPANGVRILEAPGVRLDRLHQHVLVGGEAGGDQHERALGVEGDGVDGGVTEQHARVEHGESGLDAVEVLDHQRLQLSEIHDFQLLDHQSHRLLLALDLPVSEGRRSKGGTKPVIRP